MFYENLQIVVRSRGKDFLVSFIVLVFKCTCFILNADVFHTTDIYLRCRV